MSMHGVECRMPGVIRQRFPSDRIHEHESISGPSSHVSPETVPSANPRPGEGAAFSATTERCDGMMLVMSERACEAIRSLNTFEIIDWDHL